MERNIYFVLGSPCSGKSTVAKRLVDAYKMFYFSGDENRFKYYKYAVKEQHPFMTKSGKDFFDWTLAEMIEWERGVIHEQTPYILEDLNIYAKQYGKVLFEGMLDLDYLRDKVDADRVVYLDVDKKESEAEFFQREDHRPLLESILKTPDISEDEKERRIEIRKQASIEAFQYNCKDKWITVLERNQYNTVNSMVNRVVNHFNLTSFNE